MSVFTPDYAVHPGEILEEIIRVRHNMSAEALIDLFSHAGLSSAELVKQMIGKTKQHYSSKDYIDLEDITGIDRSIWMRLTTWYDKHTRKETE